MYFLLTLTLACLTVISFCICKKDILNPMVVCSFMFMLGSILVSICEVEWNINLHLNSFVLILLGVLLFQFGCLFSNIVFNSEQPATVNSFEPKIPWLMSIIVTTFILICCYLNYVEARTLVSNITEAKDLKTILSVMINGEQMQIIKTSWIFTMRILACKALTYTSLYFLIKQLIDGNFHRLTLNNLKFLLPVFPYAILLFLTGGRQQFLYLALFIIVISVFMIQKKYMYSDNEVLKIFLILCGGALVFLTLFITAGIASGKIQASGEWLKVLVHYGGLNVAAFDTFINELSFSENQFIGTMTLGNVYANLKKLGFDLPDLNMYITQFVPFANYTTNVYTAFRRYIQDYGYFGFSIIMFTLGIIYSTFYNLLKFRYHNDFWLIVYASLCYPIFLFFREERFLTGVVNGESIKLILLLAIVFYLFRKVSEIFNKEN